MPFRKSFFLISLSVFLTVGYSFAQVDSVGERLGTDAQLDTIAYRIVVIDQIVIIGNKVTKDHIILRELPFKTGDSISWQDLKVKQKSAKENLLNTSLFNFARVNVVPVNVEHVSILIDVAERWYTWPIPIFEVQERNFNTWWQTKNLERANYGFYLNRENFRGRKEDLSFYFQFGYTEKYGLTYKIPYVNRKRSIGTGVSFSYSRNHEIAYGTFNNSLLYFKDESRYVREDFSGKTFCSYRKGIYQSHLIEAKYINARVSDTLDFYTVGYFEGQKHHAQYLLLDYFYRLDHRDAKYYPLKGYSLELEATKLGLGLLKDEEVNVLNLLCSIRKYQKLSNRFYAAGSLRIKYSPLPDQPYYVQRGLGFGDYVRGYEYYVIDAQSYGVAKLGLKYEIVKPRIQKVPLPFSKFNTFHYALYASVFGDAGYGEDRQYAAVNPLGNSLLYGYGAGIDFVTYYDIVFRFEYSFNKMMEHGFFVSFNAGI